VAGGTGFVGREIVATLERSNYEVVVVSRKVEQEPSGLFSLISGSGYKRPRKTHRTISWNDIEEDGLPSGTVAVVNSAGRNVLDPLKRWNDQFKQEVYDSRVKTNSVLASAIARARVKPVAFVTMSGVGYYPPSDLTCDENSPGGQHDFLSRLVTDWEAAAQLPAGTNTRVCRLRAGVVLGRNGGMIQQTFLPFYLGLGGPLGWGAQTMPWVHVKDVARLVVHCVQSSECEGVYNAVAPHVITNKEFAQAFGRALNRPAVIPFPLPVMSAVFGSDRCSLVTASQVVVPKRTQESGFQFHYPTIGEACEEFAHMFYIDPDNQEIHDSK